jgi:hypothetical protein
MNGVWKNVWPESIHGVHEFANSPKSPVQIVEMSKATSTCEEHQSNVAEML